MIGSDLEYIMTSLPYLSFEKGEEKRQKVLSLLFDYAGVEPGQSSPLDILDQEASKFLPSEDFLLFQKVDLKNIHQAPYLNTKSPTLSSFAHFVLSLKKGLADRRNPQSEKSISSPELLETIDHGSPLEIEERLLKLQWDQLEDLSSGHFSDLDALIIYKLKLSILLRWWSFDAHLGYQKFIHLTKVEDHG